MIILELDIPSRAHKMHGLDFVHHASFKIQQPCFTWYYTQVREENGFR